MCSAVKQILVYILECVHTLVFNDTIGKHNLNTNLLPVRLGKGGCIFFSFGSEPLLSAGSFQTAKSLI